MLVCVDVGAQRGFMLGWRRGDVSMRVAVDLLKYENGLRVEVCKTPICGDGVMGMRSQRSDAERELHVPSRVMILMSKLWSSNWIMWSGRGRRQLRLVCTLLVKGTGPLMRLRMILGGPFISTRESYL